MIDEFVNQKSKSSDFFLVSIKRYRRSLSTEYFKAKVGVDKAENGTFEVVDRGRKRLVKATDEVVAKIGCGGTLWPRRLRIAASMQKRNLRSFVQADC